MKTHLDAFSKFQKAIKLIFYTFVTLLGCWGPFWFKKTKIKTSKNEKSQVKVMTLTLTWLYGLRIKSVVLVQDILKTRKDHLTTVNLSFLTVEYRVNHFSFGVTSPLLYNAAIWLFGDFKKSQSHDLFGIMSRWIF